MRASSSALPKICNPIGNWLPFTFAKPHGTLIPRIPAPGRRGRADLVGEKSSAMELNLPWHLRHVAGDIAEENASGVMRRNKLA